MDGIEGLVEGQKELIEGQGEVVEQRLMGLGLEVLIWMMEEKEQKRMEKGNEKEKEKEKGLDEEMELELEMEEAVAVEECYNFILTCARSTIFISVYYLHASEHMFYSTFSFPLYMRIVVVFSYMPCPCVVHLLTMLFP